MALLSLVLVVLMALGSHCLAQVLRSELRADGVPLRLMAPGALEAEFAKQRGGKPNIPFRKFSEDYVRTALATPTDWMEKGAVTPAKDQGGHGYCGTFGRVAAAEGQYALRSGHGLRNFSEEELVDCIGWDMDQFSYFQHHGFMDAVDYPYKMTGPDMDPPIPGSPCEYDVSQVIRYSDVGAFTGVTDPAPSEDQLVAFVHRNGPVQTGVHSSVFGLRGIGCEASGDCFITAEMCNDPTVKGKPIDHSITLTGYGTDPTYGDYWIVKNSWSTNWANRGFIKVARGVSCARIDCCGTVFTYGDPSSYYEESSPQEPSVFV